uniref:non-specific serine/threonine protein kinase n=1 Tax=Saccoglossus kowalevskii TaxID=10224 RepID=A0ABM0H0Q0_SACKO|nr:PREDICTED: SRSF protein kinase 2-like [Saccoglossus kowalevskii]
MSSRGQRKVLSIQARKRRTKPPKNRIKPDDRRSSKKASFEQHGAVPQHVTPDDQDRDYDEDDDEEEEVLGSDDEEQEDPKDYCKGGYHPVKIGDLFHNRYHVVRKLGWGHFSTVWLSWDLIAKRYVALKVVKSAQHYTETAVDEIKLLRCVRECDESDPYREKVVQLLDDFKISGVNGVHVCMVFEVLGNNLLKPIIKSNYMGLPHLTVKNIIKQVLQGLDYLHSKCKIIHTDIKPENILMCVDEEHVRKLAAEANSWIQHNIAPPNSSVSTAPIDKKPQGKISKNKKKKLKKKQKRQLELIQKQKEQLQEIDEKCSCGSLEKGQGDCDSACTGEDSHQGDVGVNTKDSTSHQEIDVHNKDGGPDLESGVCTEDNGRHDDEEVSGVNTEEHCLAEGGVIVTEDLVGDSGVNIENIGPQGVSDVNIEDQGCQGDSGVNTEDRGCQEDTKTNTEEPGLDSAISGSDCRVDNGISDGDDQLRENTINADDDSPHGDSTNAVDGDNIDEQSEVLEENEQQLEAPLCNMLEQQQNERVQEVVNNNRDVGGDDVDDEEDNDKTTSKDENEVPMKLRNGDLEKDTNNVENENDVNKQNRELSLKNEEIERYYCIRDDLIASSNLNEQSDKLNTGDVTDHKVLPPLVDEDKENNGVLATDEINAPEGKKSDPSSPPPLVVKIADLGNACWVTHHFTEDIQTRQYRALEVLLGAGYSTPADIWSTACMAFELCTGDYLFEPHSGDDYSRDEDHIAHVVELLGPIPRYIALSGKYSREFFNKRGELRHIHKLKPWDLYHVLVEKYEWPHSEAEALTSFLVPMLEFAPEKRATAAECLLHPWLSEAQI